MVETAIIPAAGLGTRLQPVTTVVPKELLPIGTKPMIDYALEEALSAGIKRVIVVLSPDKPLLQQYLRRSSDGEASEAFSQLTLEFVYQPEPLGVADAVLYTRPLIGEEPFALLFPDNVIFANPKPLAVLIDAYDRTGTDILGITEVKSAGEARLWGNCGRVDVEAVGDDILRITKLHDKAPGYFELRRGEPELRMFGRYILKPHFFDYAAEFRAKGRSSSEESRREVDDVPVLQRLIGENPVHGLPFSETVWDIGNPRGYLAAQAALFKTLQAQ